MSTPRRLLHLYVTADECDSTAAQFLFTHISYTADFFAVTIMLLIKTNYYRNGKKMYYKHSV